MMIPQKQSQYSYTENRPQTRGNASRGSGTAPRGNTRNGRRTRQQPASFVVE